MPKIKIALHNAGGELDHRVADTEDDAVLTMINFVRELESLSDGDTFFVTEIPD